MKKSLISLLISTVSLGGCVGLEVANAIVQSGNSAVSDLIPAERMTVVSNDLESATPVVYKQYVYRGGQDCRFSALVIPYERTWPEEVRQGDGTMTVRPPEPGKVAGYISVIYKKSCPGLPDESVLRAGRQATVTGTGTILTRAFSSDRTTYFMSSWDSAIYSHDMLDRSNRQNWWPQVVERLTRLANTNPKVKMALTYGQPLFVQAAPDQADAIRIATTE